MKQNKKALFSNALRLAIIGITLFLNIGITQAQGINHKEQTLRFVFIDHEPTLPSDRVIAELRKLRTRALENENALILYMPSDRDPIIVKINVDEKGETAAAEESFNHLVEALNLPSHNKDIEFDRKKVVELLDHITDDNGELTYYAVRLQFLLTSEFWRQGYNESILGPIFFALDGKKLMKKDFNFDVYTDEKDRPTVEEGKLFGDFNWGDINNTIQRFDFDF